MDKNLKILPQKEWPQRLLEIPQPPKKLWIKGKLPNTDSRWLTVVGSRKYTRYGEEVCKTLINNLEGRNIVIVSGLAVGIDSIALENALDVNLKCVAIPGSGLNEEVLFPPENLNLAKRIIENNGCLISELDPDQQAAIWTFPMRNRIMVGLSHAVLIIEAEQKSGTLITSRLATDYNRDVLTVPGSIFSKSTEGPHMLIRLGAIPITNSEDLLEALGFDGGFNLGTLGPHPGSIDIQINEIEKIILENLKEPKNKDILSLEMNISQGKLNETLSLLELKGFIKEFGGIWRIK
jgi:DNA processing protein